MSALGGLQPFAIKSPALWVDRRGSVVVLIIVVAAILALWLAPFDPNLHNFKAVLARPGLPHVFGTD